MSQHAGLPAPRSASATARSLNKIERRYSGPGLAHVEACFSRQGRVIALFGTDLHFGSSLRRGDADDNFAPGTVEFFVARLVPDRVLISQIAGDSFADVLDFLDAVRKECRAPGHFRKLLQRFTPVIR